MDQRIYFHEIDMYQDWRTSGLSSFSGLAIIPKFPLLSLLFPLSPFVIFRVSLRITRTVILRKHASLLSYSSQAQTSVFWLPRGFKWLKPDILTDIIPLFHTCNKHNKCERFNKSRFTFKILFSPAHSCKTVNLLR